MEPNKIIINGDSITTTIGNTQVIHTEDDVTFTRLDSGEYLIIPGSSVPTITSISNCDPHFGITHSVMNCDPHFGVDYSTSTDCTVDPGDFSDGYHTFNELYEHRTALFATLCRLLPERAWKSCFHSDGTMFDDMFIAGIETPEGTYSYHCENKYWAMFDGVPELTRAPEWDGHEPEDYERLFSLKRHELPDFSKLAWNEGEEA